MSLVYLAVASIKISVPIVLAISIDEELDR